MSSVINVIYPLTWESPDVSGWPHELENGSTVYFHESGIDVVRDILDGLQLKQNISFGDLYETFLLVSNGSADLGAFLSSHDITLTDYGLGTGFVYTHPLMKEKSFVFFRQPLSERVLNALLRPFTTTAWISYLCFITALSIASLLRHDQAISADFLTYAVQLMIGRAQVPRRKGIFVWRKIANIVISFFSVIMISVYNAKVLSVFASVDELVKTAEDIFKYNYKLTSYSLIHADRFELQNSNTNILNMVELNPSKVYSTIENVVGKNKRDPREALFTFPDGFYPQALFHLKYTHELCLVSHFESVSGTPRSLYIRKDSPFREKVNIKILHLLERGLKSRDTRIYKDKYRYYCPNKIGKINPVSLEHSRFAFLVLLYGKGIALLLHIAKFGHNILFKFKF